MIPIDKIGIFANMSIPGAKAAITSTLEIIRQCGREAILEDDLVEWLGEDFPRGSRPDISEKVQLVLVFGGDGTFLRAARALEGKRVPLLGINMGRLGFLTILKLGELDTALPPIFEGDYRLERRMLLTTSLHRQGRPIGVYKTLNDAVIHMSPGNRLVEFIISLQGNYLGRYRADGLIISTPTGSTAYNMSAGGPIIQPGMDALVATPICPHALSIRPIVVGGDSRFEILIGRRSGNAALSMDGQENIELLPEDLIEVAKASDSLPVLLPSGHSFNSVLRRKLGWGSSGEAVLP